MEQPTRRLDPNDPSELPVHPASGFICPECQGPMITTRVAWGNSPTVIERLDASNWELIKSQPAKAKGRSPLDARVCTDCGFIKLYAANLAQLLER